MAKTKQTSKAIVKQTHQIQNRRYLGNKQKLLPWIFGIIDEECTQSKSFTDIFAGTGIVSSEAVKQFDTVTINDFLHSNNIIYNAFFDTKEKYSQKKINTLIKKYNALDVNTLQENYFSENFGGKYFSPDAAKKIGYIREDIQANKAKLTNKEYNLTLASLLYSVDKIANTVGHYDAYFKKEDVKDSFIMKPIEMLEMDAKVSIHQEDANVIAKTITSDIVYIDPPYNSRQYSRFYHVLETLTKWDKPELHGVALKPEPENMSDYCRVSAKHKLEVLVNDVNAKYLVVSYNNTYNSKSNSSKNKITLEEIEEILNKCGETKVYEKEHQQFNTGKTEFNNHREFLFVTKVKNV